MLFVLILLAGSGLIVGYIFLMIAVARNFAQIARDKGYPERRWFHYCFWLPFIGHRMVMAMPDLLAGKRENSVPGQSHKIAGSPKGGYVVSSWTCPVCHEVNPASKGTCVCGMPKGQSNMAAGSPKAGYVVSSWTCPVCHEVNPASKGTCVCGMPKPR